MGWTEQITQWCKHKKCQKCSGTKVEKEDKTNSIKYAKCMCYCHFMGKSLHNKK